MNLKQLRRLSEQSIVGCEKVDGLYPFCRVSAFDIKALLDLVELQHKSILDGTDIAAIRAYDTFNKEQ